MTAPTNSELVTENGRLTVEIFQLETALESARAERDELLAQLEAISSDEERQRYTHAVAMLTEIEERLKLAVGDRHTGSALADLDLLVGLAGSATVAEYRNRHLTDVMHAAMLSFGEVLAETGDRVFVVAGTAGGQ